MFFCLSSFSSKIAALKCCFLPLVLPISQSASGAQACVSCGGTLWLRCSTHLKVPVPTQWPDVGAAPVKEKPRLLFINQPLFCFLLIFLFNVILEVQQGNYSDDRKLPKKTFGKWSGFKNLQEQSCVLLTCSTVKVFTAGTLLTDGSGEIVYMFSGHQWMLNC